MPWLLANFHQANDTQLIKGTTSTKVVSISGLKVAIIGLSYDFRDTSNFDSNVQYESYVTIARREIKRLQFENIDLFIALTHMTIDDTRALVSQGMFCI